jgi:PAS domain S-box-containing protein
MNDSVFITDSQRQIFDANQAAARWVGYDSPDDFIGLPLQSVLHISGATMTALLESKEFSDEIQLVSNRKMYYFEPRVSSLYDHHKQLRGHVIVLRDITERKTAQEIARRNASKLETRNQDLQAFSHTVAHDLKNPVSGMIIQAQVLMIQASRDLLPPEVLAQNLGEIERSGHRMINIIDGLLLLAEMNETDEDTLLRVNTTHIARSAVDRFGWEIRNENIDVQIEGDLPAVFAHAAWLEEVFANLIENAIKYLGENNPEPRITIRGYPLDDHNRFEIQDNGVGIKQEDQAKLFEKFSRFHENEASGLGLGLAIVLRIVKRLGGEVGVQSEPGIGSTFWFTLPALRRSLKIEDVRQQDTEQRLAVHSVEKV